MSPCQAQNITRLWESEIYDFRSFWSKVSTTLQGGTNGELDLYAIWRHLVTFLAFDDIYILDMYLPTKFHVNWTKSKGVMVSQAFGYIFDI